MTEEYTLDHESAPDHLVTYEASTRSVVTEVIFFGLDKDVH